MIDGATGNTAIRNARAFFMADFAFIERSRWL
jgi:hypothetical protein